MADAWQKKLPLHGDRVPRHTGEDEKSYLRRSMPKWGLYEWVNFTCTRRKIDRLLIEDSARGHDLNNESRRLYSARNWGVVLVPARGDKWSRANAVVDLFADEMVYAPGEWLCDRHQKQKCTEPGCMPENFSWRWRDWAQEVIDQMSGFQPNSVRDDLVDSVVMALRHMRDIGLAIRREEREFEHDMQAMHRPSSKPLYPGMR
jgi:hypothetical protein